MDPINPPSEVVSETLHGAPLDAPGAIQSGQIPNSSPQIPRDNHWITILAVALFVLLSLGAVAFLYYQNQQLKEMLASYQTPLASPTPSSTALATADPTANWKTYTSSKFGFSFQYPQDSVIKMDTLNVDGSLEFNNFILLVEKTNDTLSNYVAKLKDTDGATPVTKNTGDITTIEWAGSFKNAPTHYLSFENKGYVYSFGVTPLDDMTKLNPNETMLLDQILSTFQFTEVPTASPTTTPKATITPY